MLTGNSDRLPSGFTAAEGAHQILLRNIVGQPLYGRGGDRLCSEGTDARLSPESAGRP
jgi:hypothetical protein